MKKGISFLQTKAKLITIDRINLNDSIVIETEFA
jgi:hypothetical protein